MQAFSRSTLAACSVALRLGRFRLNKASRLCAGDDNFPQSQRLSIAMLANHSARRSFACNHALNQAAPVAAAVPGVSAELSSSGSLSVSIHGQPSELSATLLRDGCQCPACVHTTSKQRLFAQVDIPSTIEVRSVEVDAALGTVNLRWKNDIQGYSAEHTTSWSASDIQNLAKAGSASGFVREKQEDQILWPLDPSEIPDFDYDAYMHDDKILYQLMRQLRVHGLAFVTSSPRDELAVSAIATRIGPIKDTFYGATWDVRTVPQAINAAYTSSDLGFHTDLLYFQHPPPHIQLLHCVQSASEGGASVFADAHKAAVDLFSTDREAFNTLATVPVNYHYNHAHDNVYRTSKPVIELQRLSIGNNVYSSIDGYIDALKSRGVDWTEQMLVDCLDKCNWGPPFSAPFSLDEAAAQEAKDAGQDPLSALNEKAKRWQAAATKFNSLLQRPEYMFERKMNPGDCVLFDNTRTLHSRKAFDRADVGKPRWLRGTYVDKDPFLSKVRVLENKLGPYAKL